MNRGGAVEGAEIIDAAVNVVACIVEAHEDNQNHTPKRSAFGRAAGSVKRLFHGDPVARQPQGSALQKVMRFAGQTPTPQHHHMHVHHIPYKNNRPENHKNTKAQREKSGSTEDSGCIEVDEGSDLSPPTKYHKLKVSSLHSFVLNHLLALFKVETDRHPYFHRNWIVRHILDHNSPLLSRKAHRDIQLNNNVWPYKTYQDIREHVRFSEIIVNFSGTANASGNTVYTQKIYTLDSIFVGYTFAKLLVMEKGQIVVDASLLNDVREQHGGGGEPIADQFLTKSTPLDVPVTSDAQQPEDSEPKTMIEMETL